MISHLNMLNTPQMTNCVEHNSGIRNKQNISNKRTITLRVVASHIQVTDQYPN